MRVLIATDGSEYSQAAVEQYLRMFADTGDYAKLVSVVEPVTHIVGAPFGVVDNYYNAYISEARTIAETHVTQAAEAVAAKLGDDKVSTEVVIGSPSRSIVESASEWKADLILMGSHGRGFWQRVYLGSVSAAVVQHAPCSVLIVRAPHLDSRRSEQTQ
jgi:nucleotide-binding universal stress UspA family protein